MFPIRNLLTLEEETCTGGSSTVLRPYESRPSSSKGVLRSALLCLPQPSRVLDESPMYIRTFLANTEWFEALHVFERVARSLDHSRDEVPTSEIELTDLAALNWDDLPFRLALHQIAALSHHKQIVTSVIDGFRVLSREAEFQHIKSIRIGAETWRDVELKLELNHGLDPGTAMQVASSFVQSSGLDGERHMRLSVDSSGWRYISRTFFWNGFMCRFPI